MAALLAVAILVLHVGIPPLLQALGDALVVDDPVEPVDAVVVLAFEAQRMEHAVTLLKRGVAPRAIFHFSPEFNDTFFARAGVDPKSLAQAALAAELEGRKVEVFHLEGCTSTFEEAQAACAVLKRWGVRRVAIVTTAWHMRRARWCFRRADETGSVSWLCFPYPLAADGMEREAWWRREKELKWVVNEWIKMALYLWRH